MPTPKKNTQRVSNWLGFLPFLLISLAFEIKPLFFPDAWVYGNIAAAFSVISFTITWLTTLLIL